jgi:hypothetical protein
MSLDGNYIFTSTTYADLVYTYSLGTPYDISTMSFIRSFYTEITQANGVWFTDDGLMMLISNSEPSIEPTRAIRRYILTTPFNTDTATFSEEYVPSITTYVGNQARLYEDGTIMVQGLIKYLLSTPYDVSTATPDGNLSWLVTHNVVDSKLMNDGVTLYVLDYDTGFVHLYKLNNAFDFTELSGGNELGVIIDSTISLNKCSTLETNPSNGNIILGDDNYNDVEPMYEFTFEYSCSSSSVSSSSSSSYSETFAFETNFGEYEFNDSPPSGWSEYINGVNLFYFDISSQIGDVGKVLRIDTILKERSTVKWDIVPQTLDFEILTRYNANGTNTGAGIISVRNNVIALQYYNWTPNYSQVMFSGGDNDGITVKDNLTSADWICVRWKIVNNNSYAKAWNGQLSDEPSEWSWTGTETAGTTGIISFGHRDEDFRTYFDYIYINVNPSVEI